MSTVTILFYFFEALAAVSALALVFTRHVFHGALWLLTCLLSLAAIFILAFAEFVAVTQLLIYAGGIMVVILFGIMLTSKISGKPLIVEHGNRFAGTLASVSLLSILLYYFSKEIFLPAGILPPTTDPDITHQIGINLMTDFALPFELAGLLLLITLAGAAIIASSLKPKKT